MNKLILTLFICLVSNIVSADKVASITIFQEKSSPVVTDLGYINKHIPIAVYSVDAMDLMEKEIDHKIKERLSSFKGDTPMELYTNAFFDLLNSSEWPEIANGLEIGAEAVELSIRYKIKKLPAIVFNDREMIYGVRSLKQAMMIFNQSQGGK